MHADKLTYPVCAHADTATLRYVLMHRPDSGIEKVTPGRALDLLYDDIVYLPKMIEEHQVLSELIRKICGETTVLEFQKLLEEILNAEDVRKEVLQTVCKIEGADLRIAAQLESMPAAQIASALITGSLEWKKKVLLFPPLPNLIFCRDLGALAGQVLLVGQASKKARRRESVLSWFIFKYHKHFQQQQQHQLLYSLSKDSDQLIINNTELLGSCSLEGGDLMMIAPGHLLVGSSERTTPNAIEQLIEFFRGQKEIQRISVLEIPHLRSYMHLDTIFTMINDQEAVGFDSLVSSDHKMNIRHFELAHDHFTVYTSLKKLVSECYPNLKIIACGNGQYPFDEREQWTDGCNLFSVKPGVSFVYERNTRTLDALQERGYKIITGERTLNDSALNINTLEKTIITIPSSELSRARGGPHCLTLPLSRF